MSIFWMSREEKAKRAELEALLTYYENEMYYAAYDILRDEALAEQAMFLTAKYILDHPHCIKEQSKNAIKNLLILCARQRAINLYRKRKKHPTYSYEESENHLGKDQTLDIERQITLADALRMLSEEDRQLLLLRYSHGYEIKEMARLLQVKETTVRKRISRAKLRFERICIAKGLIEGDKEEKTNE